MAASFTTPDVGEYSCTGITPGEVPPDSLEARRCRNFQKSGWSGT